MAGTNAAEIERIVDRKLIKSRVHYLVVWRGFGEENNTWESRMDLMADGYSAVIKRFEDERKKADGGSSSGASTPTRGRSRSRSPGRAAATPKSPRSRSKSGRGPGRPRGRSRSASVGRKTKSASPEKTKDNQEESKPKEEEPVRRSGRHANSTSKEQPEEEIVTTTTQFVSRLEAAGERKTEEEEDDALLLRSTLAVLSTPVVREQAAVETKVTTTTTTTTKTVSLAYEDAEESVQSAKTFQQEEEVVLLPASVPAIAAARGGVADLVAKLTESGWFVSFLSVAAVVGSLVASQLLPREDAADATELWRRWLPFLTPVVALLLFFHQRDARASAKWVAIALAWRCAAEMLVLIGTTPDEFHTLALWSGAIANSAIAIAFVTGARYGEFAQSKASVLLLLVGAAALFLADSWVVVTENPALESRVILMSLAVLAISLSPVLAAPADDED